MALHETFVPISMNFETHWRRTDIPTNRPKDIVTYARLQDQSSKLLPNIYAMYSPTDIVQQWQYTSRIQKYLALKIHLDFSTATGNLVFYHGCWWNSTDKLSVVDSTLMWDGNHLIRSLVGKNDGHLKIKSRFYLFILVSFKYKVLLWAICSKSSCLSGSAFSSWLLVSHWMHLLVVRKKDSSIVQFPTWPESWMRRKYLTYFVSEIIP